MNIVTVEEVAKAWKITTRRVQILCAQGRIPGAKKLSDIWVLPATSLKPQDLRKQKNNTIGGNQV